MAVHSCLAWHMRLKAGESSSWVTFPGPCDTHVMEHRLQAIATPLVQNMEKVQIIPPPKDVEPRALAWKGAAVLGKMDGVVDLWITPQDWVCVKSPL